MLPQRMGLLSNRKFGAVKPWTNMCIDLAAPIQVREMCYARHMDDYMHDYNPSEVEL